MKVAAAAAAATTTTPTNPWFADAANPTVQEWASIEEAVFDWCNSVRAGWQPGACACELCFLLSLGTCGPAIVRRCGRLHYISRTDDEHNTCFDCVTCVEMQQRVHEASHPGCDCEWCEAERDRHDDDELTDNEDNNHDDDD